MCVVRPIRPFSSDLYSTLQQCYPSLDERANQRLEIGNGQITLPPTPPPPFVELKLQQISRNGHCDSSTDGPTPLDRVCLRQVTTNYLR